MSSSDVILVQVEELVTNFTRLSDDIRFKQHREQQLKERYSFKVNFLVSSFFFLHHSHKFFM